MEKMIEKIKEEVNISFDKALQSKNHRIRPPSQVERVREFILYKIDQIAKRERESRIEVR